MKGPVSKEQYNALIPKAQGYVSYMQGAWNSQVPEQCPHPEGSKEQREWMDGQMVAVIEVQDCDDD